VEEVEAMGLVVVELHLDLEEVVEVEVMGLVEVVEVEAMGLVVVELHLDLEEVVEVVELHLDLEEVAEEVEVEDMGLVVDRVAPHSEATVAEGWEASPLVHPKRHHSTAALAQAEGHHL